SLGKRGPVWPFVHVDVGRQRHDENVAERSRFLEMANVADVQQIEDAVTVHDGLASRTERGGLLGQGFQGENLGSVRGNHPYVASACGGPGFTKRSGRKVPPPFGGGSWWGDRRQRRCLGRRVRRAASRAESTACCSRSGGGSRCRGFPG